MTDEWGECLILRLQTSPLGCNSWSKSRKRRPIKPILVLEAEWFIRWPLPLIENVPQPGDASNKTILDKCCQGNCYGCQNLPWLQLSKIRMPAKHPWQAKDASAPPWMTYWCFMTWWPSNRIHCIRLFLGARWEILSLIFFVSSKKFCFKPGDQV